MLKYRKFCSERYKLQSDLELLVYYNLLGLKKMSAGEDIEDSEFEQRSEEAAERIRGWGRAGQWREGEEWMEDGDRIVPYRPPQANMPGGAAGVGAGTAAYARQNVSPPNNYAAGGYAQAAPGTRAVDDYYNTRPTQQTSQYPPAPRRQGSASTQYTQSSNTYTSATPAPIPPVPTGPSSNTYAAVGAGAYGAATQGATAASQQYGHPERGNTCTFNHSDTSRQCIMLIWPVT